MKRWLTLSLIFLLPACGQPQSTREKSKGAFVGQRPWIVEETIEVTHCLKAGDMDWLGDSAVLEESRVLRVALRHDLKTYPGEDLIFVVVLESATRGDVFELRHERSGAKQSYRIENNGSFKFGRKGIEWTGEILGGIWTHEYVEGNIRRLLKQPPTAVTVGSALRFDPKVTCSSYLSD